MKAIKKVVCNDYYAQKYFNNKEYKYIGCTNQVHGTCPFCGEDIVSVDTYIFNHKGTEVHVAVSAAYGTCANCGSV